MALFPSVNSVLSFSTSPLLQQLIDVIEHNAHNSNDLKIRIIIPYDDSIDKVIQKFRQNKNTSIHYISEITDDFVEKAIFLIVDRKISIVSRIDKHEKHPENFNSNKNNNDDAIRNSLFVYNKCDNDVGNSVVFSHIAAFETLWIQAENYELMKNKDKVKEDFINMCAHELRSPIQQILGLSILVKNKTTDPTQQEMLDIIIRNAKRLARLTNDLLDVAKIESNLIKLEKEKFNFNEFISDILYDFANKVSKENFNNNSYLNIIKSFPQDVIFFVEADKDRLIQVIHNILNNAVGVMGYNYDKKSIYFSLKQNTENEIQISIKDCGPGIDEYILSKLFNKFISKSGKGIGLGLYITKSIIEAHGGKIWAENNSREIGATFYFTIPIVMRSIKNIKIKKILLVDNTQSFALSLKSAFEKNREYIVDVVDNPSEVLQMFVSGYYDFVILDIEMYEINGFDLSSHLMIKDDKVKVVFMTSGETNYEPIRELYGISDKNHFIKKTLAPEKIVKQLDNLSEDSK